MAWRTRLLTSSVAASKRWRRVSAPSSSRARRARSSCMSWSSVSRLPRRLSASSRRETLASRSPRAPSSRFNASSSMGVIAPPGIATTLGPRAQGGNVLRGLPPLPAFDSPLPRVNEPTPLPDRPPRGLSRPLDSAVLNPLSADRVTHSNLANAVRVLAMDAVEQAKSGHPGLHMGAADMATVLFTRFLKYDAADPAWPDRDRFVLSAGHGSMLLYSLLHLTGVKGMTVEELKNFRKLEIGRASCRERV